MSSRSNGARGDRADEALRASVHAGALLAVTGVVAWASGTPFVFPSLGPTAYVLAAERRRDCRALAGMGVAHGVGVVAGLTAYHALASGVVVTADPAAGSLAMGRVVASGVCALAATSAGMVALDSVHPPACATTLIVALGLLPTLGDGVVILAAVVVLLGAHVAVTSVETDALGGFSDRATDEETS